MTQDQKDFVIALRHVDGGLADAIERRLAAGESFDQVEASLKRAVETVKGWRIGRGV